METNTILMQFESGVKNGEITDELQIQIDEDGSISDTSVTQLTSSDCNSFVLNEQKRCNTLTSVTSDTNQSSETESDTQIVQEKMSSSASSSSSAALSASVDSSKGSSSSHSAGNVKNGASANNRFRIGENLTSDSNPDLWYLHPRFKSYWQHYSHAMSWCQKHYSVVRCLQQKYAQRHRNRTSPYMYPVPVYSRYNLSGNGQNMNGVHASFYGNTNISMSNGLSNMGRGRGRGRVNTLVTSSNGETEDSLSSMNESTEDNITSYSDSEEFEMEITDEMLQFFAHSEKHRKERDEKKQGANGSEEEKHVDVETMKVNKKAPTSEAPKERPGSRRTAEMVTLYGKGAAMIHGMETALQMTFDRNMDIKQPKVWPNMPLNTKIMFS